MSPRLRPGLRDARASLSIEASGVQVFHGDSRDVLRRIPSESIDACVCDPPYALVSIGKRFGADGAAPARGDVYARASAGFMGKRWDTGETAFDPSFWGEVLRVLKPGAHLVAFSATRTYHRLACAIEDAGFEIRDMVAWLYGSGFPKSHDVSKGIDRKLGFEREVLAEGAPVKRMIPGADQHTNGWEKSDGREYRPTVTAPGSDVSAQWEGWGTALKPALEPIVLARKPLDGSVADNVLAHGTGALNVDGCRVDGQPAAWGRRTEGSGGYNLHKGADIPTPNENGRWPANVVHDGSDEVVSAFPAEAGVYAPVRQRNADKTRTAYGAFKGNVDEAGSTFQGDSGSAARFFYSAKVDAEDRLGSKHPTVKPVDLMAWLCRLVTPGGGVVLDPFAGSGTTGLAALTCGFRAVLIEREAEYVADINRRLAWVRGEGRLTALEIGRVDETKATGSDLPLFGQSDASAARDGEG